MHRPLIFLNITTPNDTAGLQAILNEENKTKMFPLPLIQNASEEVFELIIENFEDSLCLFFSFRFRLLLYGIHQFMSYKQCKFSFFFVLFENMSFILGIKLLLKIHLFI